LVLLKEIYNFAAPKYHPRSVARLFEGEFKLGRNAISEANQVLFQHPITLWKKSSKKSRSSWERKLKIDDKCFFQTAWEAKRIEHLKYTKQ